MNQKEKCTCKALSNILSASLRPKIIPISSSSLVLMNLWEIKNKEKRVKVAYIMCSLRLLEFSPWRHIFENMLRSFWGWEIEILRINLWLSWTILIIINMASQGLIWCGFRVILNDRACCIYCTAHPTKYKNIWIYS